MPRLAIGSIGPPEPAASRTPLNFVTLTLPWVPSGTPPLPAIRLPEE